MKKNLRNIIRYIPKKIWPGLKVCGCLIAFMLLQICASAQTNAKDIKISGNVKSSNGESLNGVTVHAKNTTNTTTTDANGNFTITSPDNGTLVISYVGFKVQELAVSGRTTFAI